jgi:GTPase SAR1 family protein
MLKKEYFKGLVSFISPFILLILLFVSVLIGKKLSLSNYIIYNSIFMIFVIILTIIQVMLRRGGVKYSHQVAIIGFPQSGKTTLITSLFWEIFNKKNSYMTFIPRGKETIEKINEDISKINMGKTLGPTNAQDIFNYRVNIEIGKSFYRKSYKFEIGDFPGDNSYEYYKKFGPWLHNTPFFRWVMESDVFVFIIDCAKIIIKNEDNKAEITKAIRAGWQHILDYHFESRRKLQSRKVLLVFTKADLLIAKEIINDTNFNEIDKYGFDRYASIENYANSFGYGDIYPTSVEISSKQRNELIEKSNQIVEDYNEIIKFFDNQNINIKIFFTSPFILYEKKKFGVNNILDEILPVGN